MATDADPVTRIRKLKRAGLLKLYGRVTAGQTPEWRPGQAFEYLVLRAFELEGAEVRWPYTVELESMEAEQIDGAVHVAGLSCLIESKDSEDPVNIEPLAKLRNQLLRRPPGSIGVLFSRSGFTGPARIVAQYMVPLQIVLWQGSEVEYAIRKGRMVEGLSAKYRNAVETGLAHYNIAGGRVQ